MMDDRFIRRLKRPRHPFNEISSAKGILFYFSIISGHFSYWSDLSVEDALTHWDLQWNTNGKSDGPGDMLDFYSHYKSGGGNSVADNIKTLLKPSHLIWVNLDVVSSSSPWLPLMKTVQQQAKLWMCVCHILSVSNLHVLVYHFFNGVCMHMWENMYMYVI